jgi:hypothetical protein
VSESSETLQRYQLAAPFAQFRVRNTHPVGPLRGPWVTAQAKQGAIIDPGNVHPDDLAHLLRTECPGWPGQAAGPMLVPFPG